MKKLFRSRWTRLTLALCMSMALLSTAAYAAEDTTGGGTSASVISAFLLCLSLLLGLISPKLEARAFAFAPPAVAAVAAAFLGACGLKVVVDGMDREGLQDAMYKLLKEFLDTELGGITIEEWLGSAWDMTVTLGKIFLGHSLADKLNAFARWVAGKYGTQVGENEVYELQGFTAFDGTYIELGIGPSSYTGSLFSDCTMGTNLVPLGTFLLTSDLSFSLKVELFDGDQYGVRLYENGQVVNYAGSRVFDNQPVAGCFVIFRGTLKVMFQIRSGKFGLRSGPALDSVDVASLGISAESLSIDRAPSMSYMPELEADQGLALDVGAAGTMDENAVLQGVLDDVLAGELAVLPAPRLFLRDKLLHELRVMVRKMKRHWKK